MARLLLKTAYKLHSPKFPSFFIDELVYKDYIQLLNYRKTFTAIRGKLNFDRAIKLLLQLILKERFIRLHASVHLSDYRVAV